MTLGGCGLIVIHFQLGCHLVVLIRLVGTAGLGKPLKAGRKEEDFCNKGNISTYNFYVNETNANVSLSPRPTLLNSIKILWKCCIVVKIYSSFILTL